MSGDRMIKNDKDRSEDLEINKKFYFYPDKPLTGSGGTLIMFVYFFKGY